MNNDVFMMHNSKQAIQPVSSFVFHDYVPPSSPSSRFKSGAPTLARYGITLSTKFLIKVPPTLNYNRFLVLNNVVQRTLHHAPGGIIITSFSLCILIAA